MSSSESKTHDDDEKIEPSCGCVFCDLGLELVVIHGHEMHEKYDNGFVLCRRAALLKARETQ